MKFAIEQKFGITADTLPCADPWGWGLTFQVLRPTSRKAKQREKARQQGDPITALAVKTMVRQSIAPTPRPAPKAVNGSAELLAPGEAVTHEQEFSDQFAQAIVTEMDQGRLSPFDLVGRDRELEEAVDLVAGWDAKDEAGADVPCTPENVRDLLTKDVLVSEGNEGAGKTIGDVLVQHLLAFARQHDEARQKYIEQGGKGSEQPSAGN